MVLFFTATLCISIIGLVALLAVKHWEIETGNVVLANVRPHVGRVSHETLVWFERVLPAMAVVYARRAGKAAEAWLHRTSARALLTAEHGLERVLAYLRGVTDPPPASREASMFLREVAEHKRTLVREKKQAQDIQE